eukprot:5742289-Prorocentrum_lima.AAC.1
MWHIYRWPAVNDGWPDFAPGTEVPAHHILSTATCPCHDCSSPAPSQYPIGRRRCWHVST